jgi:large subunit ribosomal protein L1
MAEKKTTAKAVTKKPAAKKAEKPEVKEEAKVTDAEIKEDLKKADAPSSSTTERAGKAKAETKSKVKTQKAKEENKPKKTKLKKSEKKHSKKYREVAQLVDKEKVYPIEEAVELAKKTSTTKFDASVDIHINLNIDTANSEQQVRGSLVLPAGTGKTKKVLAVVGSDKEKEAKDAGADFVGGDDMIAKIEKGWLDFEVVVATPDMMPHLGKIGKILGTKGLMPNPKVGTVTNEIAKTVANLKKGMVEYRADKTGIIHQTIGRVSFKNEDLVSNYKEMVDTIHRVKPSGVKGTYVQSIHIATTMGPGIKIQ